MSGPYFNAPEAGARRLLTVVFCDLVGSTSLSQLLDPEDYADVVLDYQESGRRIVEQHGGVVAQFAGDGLVIQFGYPVAHENDAERAVQTAFALVAVVAEMNQGVGAALGADLQCRIGIHAGVTVVGRLGSEGRSDMTLFGATANVAARVQAAASPGEVFVTDAVVQLLNGEFTVGDRQAVALRGIDDPVGIYRVVGRALGARRDTELIVGRGNEQSVLTRRWHDAEGGRGGVVVLVGPPGFGKSTLLGGLRRLVDPDRCIEVRARELSTLEPFTQLVDLAEQCAASAVPPSDALAESARRVRAAVQATVDGGGGSAERNWQVAVESARALGRAIGAHRRLVVIEDLHWLDASSRVALAALAEELIGTTSLLVATSRPPVEFSRAEIVEVDRLNDAEIAVLVRSVAGPDVGDDAIDQIVQRAGGVPLYAAELARTARAQGVVALPDSLQASLLARLDRSPELARPAQIACVLGDEIDPVLLEGVLGTGSEEVASLLGDMERAGLLHRTPGRRAAFAHALLREAIYGSLLQRDRRQLHRRAAEVLDGDAARDDDRLALVAHHWEHANEPVEAAPCFGRAARQAARRGAFAEAFALAERGLAVLGTRADHPDLALDLLMTKGNVRLAIDGYAADGMHELWLAAEDLAIAADNRQERSSAMNGQSVVALFAGDYAGAIERAERILRFGEQHGDRSALIRAHCSLAIPQVFAGEVRSALDNARTAIALYQTGDDQLLTYGFGTDHGVIAYSTAGMAAWFVGDAESDAFLRASIEHAEQIESPISLCLALQQASSIDLAAHRFEQARDRAGRIEEVAGRFGLPFYVGLARLARAAAEAWLGNTDAVCDANDALTVLLSGKSAMGTTLGLLQFALCQEGVGDYAGAAGTGRYGLDVAHAAGERIFHVELSHLVARCEPSEQTWAALGLAADGAGARGALGSARRARSAITER